MLSLAAVAALAAASPAPALDENKPSPPCGSQFRDRAGDTAAVAGTTGNMDNVDYIGGFIKHEPAKGEEATTANLQVKDLHKTPPTGANGLTWLVRFGTPDGERWVRAFVDFSGFEAFEWGHFEPTPATEFSIRDGATPGKLFLGADGIVQLVIPPDMGGRGAQLKGLTATASVNRTVLPAAAPTPLRGGFTFEADNMGGGSWTVAECSAQAPATPAPVAPAGPQPSGPAVGSGPLPVKLMTTRARPQRKGRRLALKLRASETVRDFAVQVVRGRRQLAIARAGSLSGTRTLRLKLKRALVKGTYAVDLAGTVGGGERRTAAYRLRVR